MLIQDTAIDFEVISPLLDFSIEAADQGHFEENAVYIAIEDLLDVLTAQDAEKIFDFLESDSRKLRRFIVHCI